MYSILRIVTLLVAAAGMVAGSQYGPTTWQGVPPPVPAPTTPTAPTSPSSKVASATAEDSASSSMKVGAFSFMVIGAAMAALP